MSATLTEKLMDAIERLNDEIDRLDERVTAHLDRAPPPAANPAVAERLDRIIRRLEAALAGQAA